MRVVADARRASTVLSIKHAGNPQPSDSIALIHHQILIAIFFREICLSVRRILISYSWVDLMFSLDFIYFILISLKATEISEGLLIFSVSAPVCF